MPFGWPTEYRQYRRYFVNVKALYKKKEVIVYTGLTLTLLAIAFFGVFALKPTLTTIAALFKEIENQKIINQKLQTKINALSQAQVNYSLATTNLKLVDEALPKDPDLSQIIYQIEVLAQKEGVTIRSLSFEPVPLLGELPLKTVGKEKTFGPQEIGVSLGLSGNYENLKSFLSSLENLRRLASIESFTFAGRKTEEGETSLSLNLTGTIYYLTEEK